jgi:hypothetical protein
VRRAARCTDCRAKIVEGGMVERASRHGAAVRLCEACLMTPNEIRIREIGGCLSLDLMPTREQLDRTEREQRRERMSRASAKVHRKRFRVVS